MQYLQVNQEFAVFIGGIPKACKREFIYNELKKHCYVKKLDMPRDHTGMKENKGHAFLHVKSFSEMEKLLRMKQVKIRNTLCDVLPYKKNENRIKEESGSTSRDSCFASGRNSAYSNPNGCQSRNEPAEVQEPINIDESLNIVDDDEDIPADWSECSSPENERVEEESVFEPATVVLAKDSLVYPEFFTFLGVSEETAQREAEFVNSKIIAKEVTKEEFVQDFNYWFNHYQQQILMNKITECMQIMQSMAPAAPTHA